MIRKELEKIMKIELLDGWKLDLHPDRKRKGWEGIALEQSKTISLSFNKDMDYFHGFLHELAHAIEIEKRPDKKGDSHDVFYADTLTKLIEKYCIGKPEVKEDIDKLITKSNDIYLFVDDKKIKEVELFGDDKRELRERGYMRWAFEDGGSEALIKLKKGLGLTDELFGMEIKVDKNLKANEVELRMPITKCFFDKFDLIYFPQEANK